MRVHLQERQHLLHFVLGSEKQLCGGWLAFFCNFNLICHPHIAQVDGVNNYEKRQELCTQSSVHKYSGKRGMFILCGKLNKSPLNLTSKEEERNLNNLPFLGDYQIKLIKLHLRAEGQLCYYYLFFHNFSMKGSLV